MDNLPTGNAPKAGERAKGACIAGVGAGTTSGAYPTTRRRRNSLYVRAIGPHGNITVRGQVARSLVALVAAGPGGVTALECSTWAFRLAAYVHELRQVYGLSVEMLWEDHDGGRHGRYILRSPVRLEAKQ